MDYEQELDKHLNIRTGGRDDSNSDQFNYPYEPTPYTVLERVANSGYFTKKNTMLDYGCGKGRVDFYISFQTKCHSIGIEYDKRIYDTAIKNQSTALSGRRCEFIMANAETFKVPESVDRCFFFNPFSEEVLRKALARVKESYYANPREILLFFYYPSDEYIGTLMTDEELAFSDEIDCSDLFDGNDKRERVLIFELA